MKSGNQNISLKFKVLNCLTTCLDFCLFKRDFLGWKIRIFFIEVLVNVNAISEGYDLPSIDCVVLARTTQSEIVFTQQIGRGLRRDAHNPNKEICILDLALNLRRRWKLLRQVIPDVELKKISRGEEIC